MGAKRTDLLLVSPYPPDRGRLSEYARKLAEGLAAKGLSTKVLSDAEPTCDQPKGNLSVVRTWSPDSPLSLVRLLSSVLRERPKVVLFNAHFAVFGRNRTTNFIGFLTIRFVAGLEGLFGFKTMVVLHSLPEAVNTQVYGLKPSFLNSLGLLLAEKSALSCDAVVVTIRLYQRIISRRFGRESSYIPHGAWDVSRLDGSRQGERDSLLFLGYMLPGKDMEMLATAFRAARARHPHLKLKLATTPHPNYPASMRQLKAFKGIEGVEYLGHLQDEDLPAVFDRCIALVLPYSSATGTSGVLHLVSAAGLPVVATDLLEFRQNLAEGAGLVLAKDAEGMALALNNLIEDRSYWNETSERSRDFGRSRSWEIVSSSFLHLVRRIGVS